MVSNPTIGHALNQGGIDVSSRDHHILLIEGLSVVLMDLDAPSADLPSSVPDSSQKVIMEGFVSASHHTPVISTLKVLIEPLSSELLPTTIMA